MSRAQGILAGVFQHIAYAPHHRTVFGQVTILGWGFSCPECGTLGGRSWHLTTSFRCRVGGRTTHPARPP